MTPPAIITADFIEILGSISHRRIDLGGGGEAGAFVSVGADIGGVFGTTGG